MLEIFLKSGLGWLQMIKKFRRKSAIIMKIRNIITHTKHENVYKYYITWAKTNIV